MIKKIVLSVLILAIAISVRAGEGMWLPLFLKQLNEAEMQAMGMKISAEDIYSINKGSLKDAIVSFGGFCTAEVISGSGLILTNHHCGYGQIQQHSSLENNYLKDGFWAPNNAGELSNPGLFATFIVRIEDVSEVILAGVNDELSESARQSLIDQNIAKLKKETEREKYQDILVRPFFKGNQYFLFVTETYRDVRLVGAPPSAIGKFGADTDNWVWPRHTGDFSLFRIYASKDNKPADYSPDNVPYQPKHFLPISLDGVEEGDFTMVFGFPGRTNEYLPAAAMEMQVEVINPIRIGVRDKALAVIDREMRNSEEVRIQYASKQAGIANAWKKWQGESLGIKKTGGIAKKQKLEAAFLERTQSNPEWEHYGELLPKFNQIYKEMRPYAATNAYISEITGRNIELFRLASIFSSYQSLYTNNGLTALEQRLPRLIGYLEGFYKNYNPDIDMQVFESLMEVYFTEVRKEHRSSYAQDQLDFAKNNYHTLAKTIYAKSMLPKADYILKQLKERPEAFFQSMENDPGMTLYSKIIGQNNEVIKPLNESNKKLEMMQRKYMKGLMTVFSDKRFYPDANGTMRVTYGQVKGYEPRDAVRFTPYTYLKGVVEKYEPGDYEFDVPAKLLELYESKDYGQYASKDGKMPVCFIGSNHTTGGNSGSPAIDAHGNLIGLNFDRAWEGTMSDINYDPSICRNIMVDIRYVLFIVDKYAGAGHLIDELKLVHPKK